MTASTPDTPGTDPSAAVVTCVEAGFLESQTIRMIDSLRRWGGRMANLPVIAVTPRFGLPLSRATLRRYEQLNVSYVRVPATTRYPWFVFMNKPATLLAAEQVAKTDTLIWLDADIIVSGEPRELLLEPGIDFTACVTEQNVGTTGPGDQYYAFWVAMCEAVGMTIEDLPWATTFREGLRIRTYYNAGVFAYRTNTGYAKTYFDVSEQLLDARIQLPIHNIIFHEQAALGIAEAKLKLRRHELSELSNYQCGASNPQLIDPVKFRQATILHYHKAMQKNHWQWFMELLGASYPDIRAWLEPQGPVGDEFSNWKRVGGKLLRMRRKKQHERYIAGVRTL